MGSLGEGIFEEGAEYKELQIIQMLLKKGKSVEEVADLLDVDIDKVKAVEENILVNA